ncbi:MAG: protein-L-isoaspartate(D-aspartate) O-methyltransferase [Bacteroidales bacterium]|nr:protein-L-isoaspartate(D-aspartate) O-methyltransferase [Bacteroidales bacterium]MCF8327927.1 protein-L-isoaspartate(D-aspartate) O-methyltransferase [Bacteroidales bacterium]
MVDSYRHKGMRLKLVETVREKGISDEKVLKAMQQVPRHVFMDSSFVEHAYEDKAFPIGSDQTISQPYTVAFQSELLQVEKGDKILEVGTGSGYQACVLAEMGAKVFSIERHRKLYLKAREILNKLNYYRVKIFYGDGFEGLPTFAPFDKMIITAAAPVIPKKLIDQLKVGGTLVIPLGESDTQVMKTIVKQSDGTLEGEEHGYFKFVPMLRKKAND